MDKNEILDTMGISRTLESMIDDSRNFLIFVSPYLKITQRLKAKLMDAFSNLEICFFIYRKNELMPSEEEWLSSIKNVYLIGVENLHAKIYMNDKVCAITSMNFYEYSQINNYEIGVVLKSSDRNSYRKITENILLMTKFSKYYDLFYNTLEDYLDYTMGKCFKKVLEISNKYNSQSYNDISYIKFCDDARKIINFTEDELYEDKTAILRSANLGKERFDFILNSLK